MNTWQEKKKANDERKAKNLAAYDPFPFRIGRKWARFLLSSARVGRVGVKGGYFRRRRVNE